MATEISVPSVGESISEAVVSAWLVDEGEFVEQDAPVVVLETDKANVEVGAPASGVIERIVKRAGETVGVGEVIGTLKAGNGATGSTRRSKPVGALEEPSAAAPAASPYGREDTMAAAEAKQQPAATDAGAEARSSGDRGATGPRTDAGPSGDRGATSPAPAPSREAESRRPTPSARRLMMEAQVDPASVVPSGPAGRVTRDDVQAAVASKAAPTAAVPSSAQEEVIPMSPLRRRVAQRLVEAQQTAALLTTFNEVDMAAILDTRKRHGEAFQRKHGVKLGFMSFFVKAAVEALKSWPALNAEVRGTDIVYRNRYDIGVAVGSERGLVVPVVRGADRLSFAEIEKSIGELASRARTGKLKIEELQGGTFTITNGGIYGSLLSTPIVNPPQSGILGMHKIEERPVAREGAVVIRPMMYLALTYDHRIVDGREAVSFLVQMRALLEDPTRILLEV